MSNIFFKVMSSIQQLYQRAEDLIEEERDYAISQNLLNATFQKYVTDNVGLLKDLHAELYDDWLRLYATVRVAGIYAELYVDLKLIKMEFNKDTQLIIFEQISNTEIIQSRFDSVFKKLAVNSALFFFRKVLDRDPLGPILQHYKVIEVKHGLLYLDLNRWLGQVETIMKTLSKIQVNHGVLKPTELIVHANVNLDALLNREQNDDFIDDSKQQNDKTE